MSLEEKIRALAAKGELVHLSLAPRGKRFECVYTASSPAGGHAIGEADDPVDAIEAAIKASPIKLPRTTKPKLTAAVTEEEEQPVAKNSLPTDWTKP